MKQWLNKLKQPRPYYRDYGYMNNTPGRIWRMVFKQTVIAMAIFGVFITFHDGEHWMARGMDNSVRYMLNQYIDPAPLLERAGLSRYSPENIDLSVFKNLPLINKAKPGEVLIVPVEGKISSNYGWRPLPNSKEQKLFEGIEWDAAVGTPVKAAADGQVKVVADSTQFGKTIVIQHNSGLETFYGYCTDILVHNGDLVTQSQIIAKAEKIKDTNRARVYFEVRIQGKAVDPNTKMNIVGP